MTNVAGITLYDVNDICALLSCSRYTANKLCREQSIKAIKANGQWRVTKEALEKYLKIGR